MNSIESLLGMIATEAISFGECLDKDIYKPNSGTEESDLPSIKYSLELVEYPDGFYEWVE